jgi:hypothetical protein
MLGYELRRQEVREGETSGCNQIQVVGFGKGSSMAEHTPKLFSMQRARLKPNDVAASGSRLELSKNVVPRGSVGGSNHFRLWK